MLNHWLIDEITKVSSSRNAGGDIVYGDTVTENCRFREINDLTRLDNREELDADAMVHLKPDSVIGLGDVIVYEGNYYRVDEELKARRGGHTAVEFKKCLLTRERQVS